MALVINLIGPPGTGKSTMAAEIFSRLKWGGVNCELVGEFAKELVWEKRYETMKDEVYLFAKQNHRMFRLKDKVDVIITDRPLILSILYNNAYGDKSKCFSDFVAHEVGKYNNCNFLLNRIKPYKEAGRVQSEIESNGMMSDIVTILDNNSIDYTVIDACSEATVSIASDIMNRLENSDD